MMESLGQRIRMVHFGAAEGPRIMLFGPMDVAIGKLQTCFRELSETDGSVRLERAEFIVPFGGIELIATCSGPLIGGRRAAHRQGLRRSPDGSVRFEWARSSEGWDYLADLIAGLVESEIPGHQYLTRYPDEDAIVVLSKGEYLDDVLSRIDSG